MPDDRAADLIEERDGQGALFEHFRYRLVLTDLPRSYSPRQIIDLSYQRCDQQNVIEQFGHGIAGWRMPVAEFMGNSAWLGSRNLLCPVRWCAGNGNAFGDTLFILPLRL